MLTISHLHDQIICRKKLTCIIVDDELPIHENLKFYIENDDWLELVGNFYNAFTAIEAIRDLKPYIIFLDVTMPMNPIFSLTHLLI